MCSNLEPQGGHFVASLGKAMLAAHIILPSSSNGRQQKAKETLKYGWISNLMEGEKLSRFSDLSIPLKKH